MPTSLLPLIEQAEAATQFSHVVVMLVENGIRWRPQTEEACKCMAGILGEDAKVMPRLEFIESMRKVEEENNAVSGGY